MKSAIVHIGRIGLATACASLCLAAPAHAGGETRTVDERRPADAAGQVEVINVAGKIAVVGWDRAEVEVTGTIGLDVDKVDITSSGARTTVRVVQRSHSGHSWQMSDPETANLVVHVPQRSSLRATLVSADLNVSGVNGDQELRTVSGDVMTTVAHEGHVNTVSGDIHLGSSPESRVLEITTVSGDLHVSGGGGGELTISTVSGDGNVSLGQLTRAKVKTVSGDFHLTAGLAADGRLEAESVSGDFGVEFTGGAPPAEYDLQSFSGDLTTCFGPKATHEGYGPQTRLMFKEGAGTARVRVDTRSGDVSLCARK